MSPEQATSDPADEPRWLTPAERSAWLAMAALTVKLPGSLDAQLQRDQGISFFEYMVLSVLSERADRTLQMSFIAEATSSSLSRLSHTAKRLEGQGLLRRERIPGAGRRTNAILTQAGYDKVVAAAPGHVEYVRQVLIDAVTPEQLAELKTIGKTVLSRIDPTGNWPGTAWG
ncbi:MarR family winged helix-turn-helix transcriptional regulator [Granulicoccus phenolivorans]|uniref:MarR family winged helix-turn-helix transcriptional regulator n=1 Tax=Granulicoccus phenolivorans TaxID=266854 RepID=UPI0006880932|nr:MarR family transcriptional regulator [Granulicoccus phenolivorans]